MVWKIILVLGILGLLLGFLVTGVSVALPLVTNGRVDWDEGPIFGIIGGVLVLVSFVSNVPYRIDLCDKEQEKGLMSF